MCKRILFISLLLAWSKLSFATIIFQDDFSSGNLSKWSTVGSNVSIDQTGGYNRTPAVKWNYNQSGTAPYELIKYVTSSNLSDMYVRVYFKAVATGTISGCKFIKFMGKIGTDGGYANSSFWTNNGSNTLSSIGYGYGGVQNDAGSIMYFDGLKHTDVDPAVTYLKTGSPIIFTDGQWHCYEVHMKYSTGTNRDGQYDVWLDGSLYFSARNVINHGPTNITQFDLIRFGDYANSSFLANWTLWMDNIVISDQYIGPINSTTSGSFDTTPPTVPTNISANASSSSQINLSWTASTDNVDVVGYKIYRGGAFLKTVTGTSTSDSGLTASTLYTYTVSAIDAANNESSLSSSASATTQANTSISLLTEGFEDAVLSARGWFDDGASNASIVTDATRGKVLQYSYASGASTPTTGPLRHLFNESDDLTVSYWIKYQSNWQWAGHEFYLLNNLDDSYIGPSITHLTAYIEATLSTGIPAVLFQDALNIDQTKIGVSLKGSTENRGVMGCNGTSDIYPTGDCYKNTSGFYINGKGWTASSSPITTNMWHNVKVHIKLNTIVNNIGQPDGIIQYWYDNALVLDVNNAMMRTGTNPSIKFNEIMIGPYFGGGPSQAQTFWIDGLSISTGSPSTTSLQPPAVKVMGVSPL